MVPNWLVHDTSLSARAKLCLIALLSFAMNKGSCYPSQKTLAQILGVHPRSVRRNISEIEGRGLVRVVHKSGTVNTYQLRFASDGSDHRVWAGAPAVPRTPESYPPDASAHEVERGNKTKVKKTKKKIAAAFNDQAYEYLIERGVVESAAQSLASESKVTLEYAMKHFLYSEKHEEGIGLTITRMRSGDPMPSICLECQGLSQAHAPDCESLSDEYRSGPWGDFWDHGSRR